jgi:hypothetical protein
VCSNRILLPFFFFFFIKRRGKIRINDLYFMKHNLQLIKLSHENVLRQDLRESIDAKLKEPPLNVCTVIENSLERTCNNLWVIGCY